MKNLKSTFILLGVGLALGAYIFFFERGPVKDTSAKKEKMYSSFVADDVQEIKVEYAANTLPAARTEPKSTLDLKKDDKGVWQITDPVQLKADEGIIRQSLTSLGQMDPDDILTTPGNLADYGLTNPYAKVTFFSKGKAPDIFVIGDKTINGADYYCMNPASKAIYLVQPYVPEGFIKKTNEIREHALIKTDQVTAEKVEVVYQGKTLTLAKDDKNTWNIVKPIQEKADPVKVRDLLNEVNTTKAAEFVEDNPKSLSPYGLASPRASITIWPADKTPPSTLLLGREKLKTSNYFAKLSGQNPVFLVGSYFDTRLHFKVEDYRDKTVMQFDSNQVKSLTVRHNQQVYNYSKDPKGQWTCTGRLQAENEASSLITDLSQTAIVTFADSKVSSGVENPSYVAEVTLNDGTVRKYRYGRGEKEQVYLASDKSKDVYLVSNNTVTLFQNYFNALMTPLPVTTPKK
jgi:hypothetical protein